MLVNEPERCSVVAYCGQMTVTRYTNKLVLVGLLSTWAWTHICYYGPNRASWYKGSYKGTSAVEPAMIA